MQNSSNDVWVKGEILESDYLAVAIVGTRTPSKFGKEKAHEFATELAKRKVTIVSGLARGIDTVAHRAALDVGGRTIAVLGSGIDIIYPPENIKLAEKISGSGAVVSGFPKGTAPLAKNFLARNRLVVALSLAVLVVEGKRRSGTISTAHHAADLNKEVFVVTNNPNLELSGATNYLIENGASVAKNYKDILKTIT